MRFTIVIAVIALLVGCSKRSDIDDSIKPIENYYIGLAEKNSKKYASAFDFEKLKFLGIDYGSAYAKAPPNQKEASRQTFINTAFRETTNITIEYAKKTLQNLDRHVISNVEVEYWLPLMKNINRVFVVKKSGGQWLITEVK